MRSIRSLIKSRPTLSGAMQDITNYHFTVLEVRELNKATTTSESGADYRKRKASGGGNDYAMTTTPFSPKKGKPEIKIVNAKYDTNGKWIDCQHKVVKLQMEGEMYVQT